ncbi:MBL fold hydrolase [Candidatus Campbellbacteria bacterium CG11_big_fil_rev_8_21_14_0_20_44_21]|nr:MAG: MBL fold hydrolase [Candidatus Campbellbacteria bacterium CG11_big_fil_rev_8_21_14_0_20_44_21]
MNDLKLTFYGGARSVTGANFMLESKKMKILIDCGLQQGKNFCEDGNCLDFAYDPQTVDFLLVTHAHADHIGRIPKLARDGFGGTIYSTEETRKISEIMLKDSLRFVLKEALEAKREAIYRKEDIKKALSLWKTVPYRQDFNLGKGFRAFFKDAGHILGSAIIEISYNSRKVAFSGDLGNSPAPLLNDAEFTTDADYLIMESVYGDRNHEDISLRKEKLKNIILKTIKKKGVLLIPSFSLSRTQIMLFELNNMIENGEIPSLPVFLDSPLAIKITRLYKEMQNNFKRAVKEQISSGDKIFDFPRLKFTESSGESKAINNVKPPKIIIAGSGMSHGGRIIHHEKRYLSEPQNAILFVGYQSPGSLGRIIQDGAGEVMIENQKIKIRAERETISGYSGHKGSDELLEFVEKAGESNRLKKVYVVMGEPRSAMFLVQKIRDNLGLETLSPKEGESFFLD